MNKIFSTLLLFTIFINHSISQVKKNDLIGTWINVHTDMKDGSRLLTLSPNNKQFIRFQFFTNSYKLHNNAAQKKPFVSHNYKLKNDQIIVSKNFHYDIEKATQDSLVLIENMENLEDDKLKRYHLVRKEFLFNQEREKNVNIKHLKATPYYTPMFEGNLSLFMNTLLKGNRKTLKLKGKLVIHPNDSLIRIETLLRDRFEVYTELLTQDALSYSYHYWNLAGFENFETISIDFVIDMENRKGYRGLKIKLFTNSFTDLQADYGLGLEKLQEGGKYFRLGMMNYKQQKLELAIKNFTKSYQSNPLNIDALYNRAVSYFQLKQFDKACEDWKRLSDLGQVRGINLFKSNCSILKN